MLVLDPVERVGASFAAHQADEQLFQRPRTGDAGGTALFGGTRVSKADPRVAAYGDVDELNAWIVQYVTTDPNADDVIKAEKPLAEARVEVEEVAGNPGYYTSKFFLRPHYQLEGLTVSLRLVSKLPSAKLLIVS